MAEEVFREEGYNCYTLDSTGEALHLILDMRPEYLILDVTTIEQDQGDFLIRLDQANLPNCKLFAIGPVSERDKINNWPVAICKIIDKPVSPQDYRGII